MWRREHTFNWADKRICQIEQYHIVDVDHFEPFMSDAVEAKSLDQFRWWPVADLEHSTERLPPLSLADIVAHNLREGAGQAVLEVEVLID